MDSWLEPPAPDRVRSVPLRVFKEPDAWNKGMLAVQLLRLMNTVYRVEPDQNGLLMPQDQFDPERWDKFVREVAALQIKWEPGKMSSRWVITAGKWSEDQPQTS